MSDFLKAKQIYLTSKATTKNFVYQTSPVSIRGFTWYTRRQTTLVHAFEQIDHVLMSILLPTISEVSGYA